MEKLEIKYEYFLVKRKSDLSRAMVDMQDDLKLYIS